MCGAFPLIGCYAVFPKSKIMVRQAKLACSSRDQADPKPGPKPARAMRLAHAVTKRSGGANATMIAGPVLPAPAVGGAPARSGRRRGRPLIGQQSHLLQRLAQLLGRDIEAAAQIFDHLIAQPLTSLEGLQSCPQLAHLT